MFSLEIYRLNHTGEWELTTEDQVLSASTEEKPYGFYVNEWREAGFHFQFHCHWRSAAFLWACWRSGTW